MLWEYVISDCKLAAGFDLHGIQHWRNVEKNGLIIAKSVGANEKIVRLFALFHDCKRINEGVDPGHGFRAARYIESLDKTLLDLQDDDIVKLCYACEHHTDLVYSNDITIATCWDADRLDLIRVGKVPNPEFLNTPEAKRIALEMFSNGRYE